MRTAPKYLFELSEREARVILSKHAPNEDVVNLTARLKQFVLDCQEKPLTEEETDQVTEYAIDPKHPEDIDFVAWNLPPGQQRRDFLQYMEEEPERTDPVSVVERQNTRGE